MELAYGKSLPERKRQSGHVNVFGSNGIVGNHNEKLVDGPGIIIGRKGTAGTIIWSHSDFFPIDTTFYIVAKNHIMSLLYLYHELHAQDLPHLISDSAVPGLNRNIVYMNRIVIPPTFLINKFDLIVAPFFSQMNVKNEENNKLENTRDTLLPKLISGQIRINDPEQFLNERGIEN